jgi:HK97 family phage major capsid protein
VSNELRETLKQKRIKYHEMYKAHENDLTDEVMSQLDEIEKEIIDLDMRVKRAEKAASVAATNTEAIRDLTEAAGSMIHPTQAQTKGQPSANGHREYKTLGQQFAESDAYQEWIKSLAPNGRIPDQKSFTSPPIEFKDLLTGADRESGGAFVTPAQYPRYVDLGRRPLVMRDIVTTGTIASDTFEYVRQTGETNNAAIVPESNAVNDAAGVKPESAMAFERVSEPVKTIAHWIPATKRTLADSGQLRALVDAFLRDGLEQELEDQMTTGDGIGDNFTGILETDGIQTQEFDTNALITTRRARTKVRIGGRAVPTAYAINPIDWENIELSTDGMERFYYGGPQEMATPRLWGLRVIESEAIPEGTALVGDFRWAVLLDREQSSITATNSHADFFVRNLVAILAEMRAAFGVLKPSAFVSIALTETP